MQPMAVDFEEEKKKKKSVHRRSQESKIRTRKSSKVESIYHKIGIISTHTK